MYCRSRPNYYQQLSDKLGIHDGMIVPEFQWWLAVVVMMMVMMMMMMIVTMMVTYPGTARWEGQWRHCACVITCVYVHMYLPSDNLDKCDWLS